MKKFIYTLVLVLILNSAFLIQNCFSQWQPDVRLTNNPSRSWTYLNNAWCIASNSSNVHVVWFDNRDGNDEIYYKRSTNSGIIWGADTRLTNNNSSSWRSSVAVSGFVVHVVWYDNRDGNYEIYYKRSTDGGGSWAADSRLTNNNYASRSSSIAVSGSVVHVVWQDYRDESGGKIYYKHSTDAGLNWGVDTRLSNNIPFSSDMPSIAVSGSVVHVVWYDNRDENNEIYYKRSTDAGINWGADTRLTNNTAFSGFPSIAVSSSNLHIVWFDERDLNSEIYYKRSTDGGISWEADKRLTINTGESWMPSVAVSGQVVHIVWEDNRNGNHEIYYKCSKDLGVNWGADSRLTNNNDSSSYPSLAVSGPFVHVVWEDRRDGNYEIYYKRDPTGNVGIQNISTETPSKYSLSQNYPNPFNPITNVKFSIVNSGNVKLVVYDIQGREVQTLVNESLKPGTYEVTFDGTTLNSGVYFYKLMTDGFTETKKMLMIK